MDDIELETRWRASFGKGREAPFARIVERLFTRHFDPFKGMIGLHFDLHLRLDLLEVVRRNAVLQLDIVIKSALDRRPRRELRLRPDAKNRRGQHMGARMAQPFQIGHLRAFFWILSIFRHEKVFDIDCARALAKRFVGWTPRHCEHFPLCSCRRGFYLPRRR